MIRLVNNLLTLAHADARQNSEKYILNISPVLEESVGEAKYLDRKRKITASIAPDLVILGNEDILKQVMLILIDYGVKHSSGDMRIEANNGLADIQIDVIDRGKGIPTGEQKLIFERFFQGKGESREDGFGLRLSIARTLSAKLGGKISIESELGIGSTFTLVFPCYKEL